MIMPPRAAPAQRVRASPAANLASPELVLTIQLCGDRIVVVVVAKARSRTRTSYSGRGTPRSVGYRTNRQAADNDLRSRASRKLRRATVIDAALRSRNLSGPRGVRDHRNLL